MILSRIKRLLGFRDEIDKAKKLFKEHNGSERAMCQRCGHSGVPKYYVGPLNRIIGKCPVCGHILYTYSPQPEGGWSE